jgi:L-ribulose-5-phosphate 3-epimerase
MAGHNRREFLRAAAVAAAALGQLQARDAGIPRLGMYLSIRNDADAMMAKARDLGFTLCEVYTADIEPAAAAKLGEAIKRHRMEVTALFTMGPGTQKWDFYEGPLTNGLVPQEHRRERIDHLKKASDVAKSLNIPAIETHVGYIPENPNDVLFGETVEAVREIAGYCRANGQTFLYHAGQETPTTLLRAIHDVGLDNQGIGLDTANPIMYDRGHPVYALEVYGKHLKAVNAKDGLYPTDPRNLGREVPIGKGMVDFPRFIARLKQMSFAGPILIEREISGPQLINDVKEAKVFLEKLLGG